MAIESKATLMRKPNLPKFPALRQLVQPSKYDDEVGPLVVLFTDERQGIALSGVSAGRIGKVEQWKHLDDDCWAPCSITLNNKD